MANVGQASGLLQCCSMTPRHAAVIGLTLMLLSSVARASSVDDEVEREAPHRPAKPTFGFELNMGFFGGAVDPSALPFVAQPDATATATALGAPFGPGLTRLGVAGPSWELRVMESNARFTVGARKAFGEFRPGSLEGDVGAVHLAPRDLSVWDLRFGLGAEYTFGRLTPFVDLLGDLQFASAEVTVDGARSHFDAHGFGLSARVGARVQLDRFLSLGLSGEYGVLGAPRFSGMATLGWAFDFGRS
jgi:hypothetical protein